MAGIDGNPKDLKRIAPGLWGRKRGEGTGGAAVRIGVNPRELHIRPMRRKWGSCSTLGRVTLNQELLSAPAALRREVIVEELLHLRVPNHGKLFKYLKRAYLAQSIR